MSLLRVMSGRTAPPSSGADLTPDGNLSRPGMTPRERADWEAFVRQQSGRRQVVESVRLKTSRRRRTNDGHTQTP